VTAPCRSRCFLHPDRTDDDGQQGELTATGPDQLNHFSVRSSTVQAGDDFADVLLEVEF
jgi:hypothetical protein